MKFVVGGWRPRFSPRRLFRLESLIAVACVVFALLLAGFLFEHLSAGPMIHSAAAGFAGKVRDVQELARQRNSFLKIATVPGTLTRPPGYVVVDGNEHVASGWFPAGVSATGVVVIDPQGVPREAADFKFSKHNQRGIVRISDKGIVSMP